MAARIPTHPGTILWQEFMAPMSLAPAMFAEQLGIPETQLQQIVDGTQGITLQIAQVLSQVMGTSPKFWLNLQASYDQAQTTPVTPEGAFDIDR